MARKDSDRREFLQLAHVLDLNTTPIAGKFVSEKEDGLRFFWDGGITRGVPTHMVPWANILKTNAVPTATGLWSRGAKVINAPSWWLDRLPPYPIEGEATAGRQNWEITSSIVRSNVNVKESDWHLVQALVFDIPHPTQVFQDGRTHIGQGNFIQIRGAYDWFMSKGGREMIPASTTFQSRYKWLVKFLEENETVQLVQQEQLPFSTSKAIDRLNERLEEVLDLGGEGVMVKAGNNIWEPQRVHSMLKFKPFVDEEAVVAGYTWGRETDRGSKHLGKMGAMIVRNDRGEFKLSGFTDDERLMVFRDSRSNADVVGAELPDTVVTEGIENPNFPRGTVITFRYRETTAAGIPKEARYWRKAVDQ